MIDTARTEFDVDLADTNNLRLILDRFESGRIHAYVAAPDGKDTLARVELTPHGPESVQWHGAAIFAAERRAHCRALLDLRDVLSVPQDKTALELVDEALASAAASGEDAEGRFASELERLHAALAHRGIYTAGTANMDDTVLVDTAVAVIDQLRDLNREAGRQCGEARADVQRLTALDLLSDQEITRLRGLICTHLGEIERLGELLNTAAGELDVAEQERDRQRRKVKKRDAWAAEITKGYGIGRDAKPDRYGAIAVLLNATTRERDDARRLVSVGQDEAEVTLHDVCRQRDQHLFALYAARADNLRLTRKNKLLRRKLAERPRIWWAGDPQPEGVTRVVSHDDRTDVIELFGDGRWRVPRVASTALGAAWAELLEGEGPVVEVIEPAPVAPAEVKCAHPLGQVRELRVDGQLTWRCTCGKEWLRDEHVKPIGDQVFAVVEDTDNACTAGC